ncbi:MAG TPA: alkaline phosphatase family protein [Xanthobacteraceae bacterium]|nr:alkaline phosphatase family protein [Xanthobacteraceae bacterium]
MAKLLFDHIVVLMLENRSFDHLFGYLGIGDGLQNGPGVNYLKPGDKSTTAFTTRKGGDYTAIGQGPSHSLKEVNMQLFGVTKPTADVAAKPPALDGFVASFRTSLAYDLKRAPTTSELQQVLNCFDPIQLPVLSTLAQSFVLCDRWFADVPGPTMPNRAFVHAATSQGYTYNANWKPKFTCKTLYDRLNATAKSATPRTWRSYSHDQDDILELYPYLDKDETNHVLFENNFVSDVSGDKLATYSFITPAFIKAPVNSMHAPADVRPAEKLVADVYGALRARPDVWKKTLLIIVFDEHGGYYDHVAPPATVSPDGIAGRMDETFLVPFDFERIGLRVPAILVSPWFEPGVDSTVYSHATIPGSVIDAFKLPGGFLTKRDGQSNKLTAQYLVDDGKRTWRTNVPDLSVPVQPKPLDMMQRELLDGSVHLDPHPADRNTLRTRDIHDQEHAARFVRTQNAKHLEHFFASKGDPKVADKLSTEDTIASPDISPARIAELRKSAKRPKRGVRP